MAARVGGLSRPPARAGAMRVGGPRPAKPLASPALPKPSLLSTGLGPARPSPSPHFYRQGPAQPGLGQPLTSIGQPLTSIGRPRPLISIGWPWLRSRAPGESSSGRAARAGGGRGRLTNPLLTSPPRGARAPRPPGARGKSAGGSCDAFQNFELCLRWPERPCLRRLLAQVVS